MFTAHGQKRVSVYTNGKGGKYVMRSIRTVVFGNQKGGSGKTCSAATLAALLSADGERVLCIDLNDQADFTEIMGTETDRGKGSIGLFTGEDPLKLVRDTALPGVEMIPATEDIALLDIKLDATGRERALLLANALKLFRETYKYCIIDAPGSFNTAMLNALAAANYVVIPSQVDAFSLRGIGRMITNIRQVKRTVNPGIQIAGILLVRYQGRRNLSRDAIETLQKLETAIGAKLFTAKIRENTKVAEATGHQQTVISYAPDSNGAADYREFYKELMGIINNRKDG